MSRGCTCSRAGNGARSRVCCAGTWCLKTIAHITFLLSFRSLYTDVVQLLGGCQRSVAQMWGLHSLSFKCEVSTCMSAERGRFWPLREHLRTTATAAPLRTKRKLQRASGVSSCQLAAACIGSATKYALLARRRGRCGLVAASPSVGLEGGTFRAALISAYSQSRWS